MSRSLQLWVLGACALATPSTAQMTPEEAEVWDLELAYYEYAAANDPEGYLSLFDDGVIGWPAPDAEPKGKDRVSQWIAAVHADPSQIWSYELERRAIRSFGDSVVVHYVLREAFRASTSGEELRSAEYKISHTWQRRNGKWRIISGMGAVRSQ